MYYTYNRKHREGSIGSKVCPDAIILTNAISVSWTRGVVWLEFCLWSLTYFYYSKIFTDRGEYCKRNTPDPSLLPSHDFWWVVKVGNLRRSTKWSCELVPMELWWSVVTYNTFNVNNPSLTMFWLWLLLSFFVCCLLFHGCICGVH